MILPRRWLVNDVARIRRRTAVIAHPESTPHATGSPRRSSAVADAAEVLTNAIAAVLLAMRDSTGTKPQCYFQWSEGSPVGHLMRYLFLGEGDTAPLVREILREVERDPALRPGIHVG